MPKQPAGAGNSVAGQSAAASRPATDLRIPVTVLGVLLVAINLRGAVVAVGPLLNDMSTSLGLSSSAAGLLTGLPLVAFALFAPVAPLFARQVGLDRAIWLSVLILAVGSLVRSAAAPGAVWVGTILIGIAIAFLNVLLSALVKRDFRTRVSNVTGLYIAAQGAVTAGGAAIMVPLAQIAHDGWRIALATWAVLAIVTLAVTVRWLRHRPGTEDGVDQRHVSIYRSPWKTRLGWQISFFMGLQSMVFFILITWLPSIQISRGVSEAAAALQISIFLMVGVIASLGTGAVLDRASSQRAVAVAGSLVVTAACAGFAFIPAADLLWVILASTGCGSLIVTALSLFSLRTEHHTQAGSLSGMAQSIGYALSAIGPVGFGALHDVSGGWTIPLVATAALGLPMTLLALPAGGDRYIGRHPLALKE